VRCGEAGLVQKRASHTDLICNEGGGDGAEKVELRSMRKMRGRVLQGSEAWQLARHGSDLSLRAD
jgi:hypothetical protein